MARYKGRLSPKSIERDYPHHVEIAIPPGGLGRRLNAMHALCAERGIPSRAFTHRKEGEFYIRWCFADPAMAVAFAAEFDGSIPTNTRPHSGGKPFLESADD
jgi:hypothetical protein